MRPSISVSLEPGLEQGVPWGRDLYTFVTSAAGHMMRTLQKPRKNRPSKRQVNHRRFLHNMIQRKFADIEAAKHRLASALYVKDGEKNTPSLASHKPEMPEQSGKSPESGFLHDPDKCSARPDTGDISKSRSEASTDLYETEVNEKKHQHHPKLQSSICTTRANNQSKGRQKKEKRSHKLVEFTSISFPNGTDDSEVPELFQFEYCNDESQPKPINNLPEDTQTPVNDSSFIQLTQTVDISPSFFPDLSPLSLDSCDFSIQTCTDKSVLQSMGTQAQKDMADISEGQLTDIIDLFSVSNKDFGAITDVEACIESICAYQDNAELEVGADDVTFSDQSDSFTEVEDLHCEKGEYTYEYRYTTNHFQINQRSSKTLGQCVYTPEEQFNSFQSRETTHNQLHTSVSYHCSTTQHPQEESTCMLVNCDNNPNFMPFEGVAQSFSVPLHNPDHRLIPLPPHEDDWLFTDILKDRKSLDCE